MKLFMTYVIPPNFKEEIHFPITYTIYTYASGPMRRVANDAHASRDGNVGTNFNRMHDNNFEW